MTNRIYRVALIGLLILTTINAKRTRRIKPTPEEDSSPQPSVVSYSTFGFNDVGSYDGFVPSSPDYVNYLNNANQANQDPTPTRLYAPAFPDTSGFGSQAQDGQPTGTAEDNNAQPSIMQYNSASYYNPGNLDHNEEGKNDSPEEKYRRIVDEESNSPVYGTKLGANKIKHSYFNQYNDTAAFNVYSSGPSSPGENKYVHFKEPEPTHESKPTSYGESASSIRNIYNYAPTYPPTEVVDDLVKTSNNTVSLSFPKVIDFTKYKHYYPTELEHNSPTATFQPLTKKKKHENKQNNDYEIPSSSFNYPPQTYKHSYKVTEEDQEKEDPKPSVYTHHDYPNNFVSYTSPKSSLKGLKSNVELKDKVKQKPWDLSSQFSSGSYNSSNKNWRNPVKSYEYSTDFSNMSFKFDTSTTKKPFNSHTDEQASASNNVADLSNYNFPETDYSSFKKIPGVKAHYEDDYSSAKSKYKDLFKSDDYINQFKNLYSNSAPISSSLWGNVNKDQEFTSHKHHSISSQFRDDEKHHSISYPFRDDEKHHSFSYSFRDNDKPHSISSPFRDNENHHSINYPFSGDEITNDVVHIPKKPYSHKFSPSKYSDRKPSEWSYQNKLRQQKPSKPKDWTKDVSITRFKSEEDLLGLRTHDTAHPSYLPSYNPFNDVSDEFDYKKLVEKWRQSYLKSKYKEAFRDFETYASDAKPVHVPIPKPYAIEIPRPVIVPVPQPYPVRVPIPKPVAVPIVKELTVQIEKPVPYPVYKNVPYPVEKPVPVHVEKKVPVPVVKPYPVPVPHIRPVFHHTRPSHDEFEEETPSDEDDYHPRPESYRTSKKVPYSKRPKSARYRARRPMRATYQDRNRRRWPARRPGFLGPSEYPQSPYRSTFGLQEYERSDYYLHCKRTGKC